MDDEPSASDVVNAMMTLTDAWFHQAPRDILRLISEYTLTWWDERRWLTTSSILHLIGNEGMTYLCQLADGTASRTTTAADAVTLYVRPVVPSPNGVIKFGQEFYIMTRPWTEENQKISVDHHSCDGDGDDASHTKAPSSLPSPLPTPSIVTGLLDPPIMPTATIVTAPSSDRLYLERTRRISDETPTTPTHYSCRFGLGFVSQPTQTWIAQVSQAYPGDGLISLDAIIGLTIAGTSTDEWSAQFRERRWLTLRYHDEPAVTVRVMKHHECVLFVNAIPGDEHLPTTSTSSTPTPASLYYASSGGAPMSDAPLQPASAAVAAAMAAAAAAAAAAQ